MSIQKSGRASILAVGIVLIIVVAGFGYYYYVASSQLSNDSQTMSSLSDQISRLQNLANAKASIKVVVWLASSTDTTSNYQVRMTNNNHFDVTLAQLTVNVSDSAGNQVASNTIAPGIVVAAGASVTTTVTISPPSGSAGASVSAIVTTPYGQIIIGTA